MRWIGRRSGPVFAIVAGSVACAIGIGMIGSKVPAQASDAAVSASSLDGRLHQQKAGQAAASRWAALPNNGLNAQVNTLAFSDTDLYAGGEFTRTADSAVINLNHIAKLSGGTWSALSHNGLKGVVSAIAISGTDLYVGGFFGKTADNALTNLNHIAKLSVPSFKVLLPLIRR